MKHLVTLCLFLISLVTLQAQLVPDWAFRREIALSNTSATNDFTGGPIHFVLNGETLKTDGKINNDFSDLRVSIDCDGDSILTHWIENPGNTSDSVVVWVRYPDTIAAAGSVNVYAFYGNSAAPNVEDFNTIFPNRIVLSADSTITDTIVTDWFEVPDGITLTGATQAGVHLIQAARIKIDGAVSMDGLGEDQSIATPAAGAGTGGDGFGGGGGAHASDGGASVGAGTPGAGGTSVPGTPDGFDIEIGFAGGLGNAGVNLVVPVAAPTFVGGLGGGIISLKSQLVTVDSLSALGLNGENGVVIGAGVTVGTGDPPVSGAGGGAGGTVKVEASLIAVSGLVSANGGNGGANAEHDNGAGGGGSGGRVKLFAPNINNNGTISAAGGSGGTSGMTPGENGGAGTTHQGAVTEHPAAAYTFGPETPTTIQFLDAVAPDYQECRYDSIGYTISSGFDSYEYYLRGASIFTSTDTVFGTDTLSFDAETYVLGTSGVCVTSSDTITLDILSRPLADFTANGINLTWEFTDASLNADEYEWDFGDGETSTEQNPTHKYDAPGDYTVCLTAINDTLECPTFVTCLDIKVECNAPTAGIFFPIDRNGLRFTFVEFGAFGESFFWDFGDGNTSTERSPVHDYDEPGPYVITHVASNECGSDTVVIRDTARCDFETTFTFEQLGNSLTVEFTNTTPGAKNSTWEFGDGVTTSGGQSIVHTFPSNGAYQVCLQSQSGCGTTLGCELITVLCDEPQVDYTFTVNDTTANFTADTANVIGGVLWDFDDLDSTTTELNPTYTFSSQGTYNVCLEVSNTCATRSSCQSIEAECPDPLARFEFIRNGYEISFGDSSVNAVSWFWDFGDGTTSTEQHPVHVYPDDTTRTYFPCLTIRNSCNESKRTCKSFKLIKKPDPVGVADFSNEDFRLFPNPVQEVLYVSTPVALDTYRLVSYNGAVLEEPKDFNGNAIDVSNLSSGSYILELSTESGQLIRKRFVKY